jgi:predicted PurR-regulated permease PerM
MLAENTGWLVGFAVAFAIIVVVVVIVASILALANKIGKQAREAIRALEQGRVNTQPLWDLHHTNESLKAILDDAQRVRETVEAQR